ncbi:MAG: hypothetical protein M2R45_00234 [Verrucomicrobia subdivision 3 bacterium]|nr:hypothetical protein [Limisphaerales bacterium]MCS1412308.1 hypothetical protein [Limisphaerales bacterium]
MILPFFELATYTECFILSPMLMAERPVLGPKLRNGGYRIPAFWGSLTWNPKKTSVNKVTLSADTEKNADYQLLKGATVDQPLEPVRNFLAREVP